MFDGAVSISSLRKSRKVRVGGLLLALLVMPLLTQASLGSVAGLHAPAAISTDVGRHNCLEERHQHTYYDPRPHNCRLPLDGSGSGAVSGTLNAINGSDGLKGDPTCMGINMTLQDGYWSDTIGEWTGWGDDGGAFTDLGDGTMYFWYEFLSDAGYVLHEGTHLYEWSTDESEAQYWSGYCSGFIVY